MVDNNRLNYNFNRGRRDSDNAERSKRPNNTWNIEKNPQNRSEITEFC